MHQPTHARGAAANIPGSSGAVEAAVAAARPSYTRIIDYMSSVVALIVERVRMWLRAWVLAGSELTPVAVERVRIPTDARAADSGVVDKAKTPHTLRPLNKMARPGGQRSENDLGKLSSLPTLPATASTSTSTLPKITVDRQVTRMPRTLSSRKPVAFGVAGGVASGVSMHNHRRCTSSSGTASTATATSYWHTAAGQSNSATIASKGGGLSGREQLAVALRCAIVRREVRSIESLLEHKAEVVGSLLTSWADPFNNAMIHTAVATAEPAVVEALIRYIPPSDRRGVVNFPGPQGQTALHISCTKHALAITEILLKNGANPNAQTNAATRPLHLATSVDDLALCRLLLEHKADPNCISNFNAIPLLTAVRIKNLELVRLLLEHGADPLLSANDSSDNARCLALQTNQDEVIRMIDEELEKRKEAVARIPSKIKI